jgi:hypothetical protein
MSYTLAHGKRSEIKDEAEEGVAWSEQRGADSRRRAFNVLKDEVKRRNMWVHQSPTHVENRI